MFLIVHTGDDFGLGIEQIGYIKDRYPDARIAIYPFKREFVVGAAATDACCLRASTAV